ncbi:hypothetical protein [Sorangium sp. So ce1389]
MLYGDASCSMMGWLLLLSFIVMPQILSRSARFMSSQGRRRTVQR